MPDTGPVTGLAVRGLDILYLPSVNRCLLLGEQFRVVFLEQFVYVIDAAAQDNGCTGVTARLCLTEASA